MKARCETQEEQSQKLQKMSTISLWLDGYDDIFSDFDQRPTEQRSLSDDFLYEAKKASKDKDSGNIELNLLLEKCKRNRYTENVIKRRLRQHFNKHFKMLQRDMDGIVRKGLLFVLFGIAIMFAASFVLFEFPEESFVTSFLIILLEPAGWFLFWEGMHMIIFDQKKLKPDLDFYEKMSKCEICFLSY